MAKIMGPTKVEVKVDQQVVVNQVWGEYEAKKEKIKACLKSVLERKNNFDYYNIIQVLQM